MSGITENSVAADRPVAGAGFGRAVDHIGRYVGLSVANLYLLAATCTMSGVMGGEIVMLGLVALPQMPRLGYDRKTENGPSA